MKKIIAIGGGEIGRPGTKIETCAIDREIIKSSGKTNPKLLFIPTASGDSDGYFATVKKYFGAKLKCQVDVLNLIANKLTVKEIKDKILNTDIVYVGGGNTLKMMKIWRRLGVDKILAEAYKRGVVMSGVSAGAICWFRCGNSDSLKFKNQAAKLIKVNSLNFVDALLCPHYDKEIDRPASLKAMMAKTSGIAIALDNCCAIEIIDDKYRIIKSQKAAKAYKIFWKNSKYYKIEIMPSKNFEALDALLKKD
ncbi:MAG: Type 1 glutamine amidotransferase-like domain-containing protein [Candidatus Falkowbacteria bacterium]